MDAQDCPNMELSDYCLLSYYVHRLCMVMGDNRCSRSICGGGLSPPRSTTPNLDVSGCPGIRNRLALGEIGRSNYPFFPDNSDFVASNHKANHPGFLSLSFPLFYVDGYCYSWNTVPGILVAIEKGACSLERLLTPALLCG